MIKFPENIIVKVSELNVCLPPLKKRHGVLPCVSRGHIQSLCANFLRLKCLKCKPARSKSGPLPANQVRVQKSPSFPVKIVLTLSDHALANAEYEFLRLCQKYRVKKLISLSGQNCQKILSQALSPPAKSCQLNWTKTPKRRGFLFLKTSFL